MNIHVEFMTFWLSNVLSIFAKNSINFLKFQDAAILDQYEL